MRTLLNWFRRPATGSAPSRITGRLRGTFYLRSGQITGWIDGDTIAPGIEVEVFVQRGGNILAAAPTVRQGDPPRYRFKLAAPAGFDPPELLDNIVTIGGRTAQGDTGTLVLDGAAQLELIRRYLGPAADFVLDLDFTAGGNARASMGEGWSAGEPDFTWTDGGQSVLRFPTPAASGQYSLRVTAGAHLHPPELTSQYTEVLAGGTFAGSIAIGQPGLQFNEILFSGAVFAAQPGTAELRFRHLHATKPSSLSANKDTRTLALCFRRLTLARLRAAEG